ncbi:hypothetical protein H4R19_000177 [Coemansia spiralis]|nr:hypothetical protein H4R19_000177 [Coemansia spiralis]
MSTRGSSSSIILAKEGRSSVFSRQSKSADAPLSDGDSAKDDFASHPAGGHATGSSLGTFVNILCLAMGVGTLQLPYTVRQSGWFGTAFIPLAAMVAFLNSVVTVRCMYLKPGGGRIGNYHEIGFEAFGKLGYYAISAFNIVNIIGSIGIYVILASSNTSDLLAQVGVHVSPRILMIASTAVMCIPTLFAKTLAETFLVSLIGTITSAIVTVAVVAMACAFPIRNGDMRVGSSTTHVGAIAHHAVLPGGFSMALSSVTFAYIGSTIVPHLEAGMRRPQKFTAVFGLALAVIAAIYVVIAATGYWAYGDRTLSPVTQNFPRLWPTTLANISMTIHVLFAGPLYLVQMALEIEDGLAIARKGPRAERLWRLAVRVGCALVILAIAEAIPFFNDVISLVGALTNPVLIYLAPIACYLKLRGWGNCSWPLLAGLATLLVFGMVVSGFGLVQTVVDIVATFRGRR